MTRSQAVWIGVATIVCAVAAAPVAVGQTLPRHDVRVGIPFAASAHGSAMIDESRTEAPFNVRVGSAGRPATSTGVRSWRDAPVSSVMVDEPRNEPPFNRPFTGTGSP